MSDVERYDLMDEGLEQANDGSWVRARDYDALASKLGDSETIRRSLANDLNTQAETITSLELRLDAIREKCEAGAGVNVGTNYPYGDGYRQACADVLRMVAVERQTPEAQKCWHGALMTESCGGCGRNMPGYPGKLSE